MMAGDTSWADVALAAVATGPALAAAYFAAKASGAAVRAHKSVEAVAPVIQAIDDAVNNREAGAPTISEDIAASRRRQGAQDAAAADPDSPSHSGAADRAAVASGEVEEG